MTARPGFTLLEGLVALAIAGAVLAGFYQAVGTAARSAGRLAALVETAERQRNALELAQVVNPMAEPQGRLALARYAIAWTSRAVEVPRPGAGPDGGPSAFLVGLYRLELEIVELDGRVADRIAVDRVGWRRMTGAERTALTPPADDQGQIPR
ncbi:PulJ/GspJ family protein [Zavarzinia sp. CC-PAN008]|uniref:PulJ/GspJ family protein n=1 Tax=Zavarzinia sp. CC-PAN008 TaxID=3243332 RepID=UPI003F748AFE